MENETHQKWINNGTELTNSMLALQLKTAELQIKVLEGQVNRYKTALKQLRKAYHDLNILLD